MIITLAIEVPNATVTKADSCSEDVVLALQARLDEIYLGPCDDPVRPAVRIVDVDASDA